MANPWARNNINQLANGGSFTHAILDLWVPQIDRVDVKAVNQFIKESAEIGNLKVIKIETHRFHPNGFTTFALLSQSHIAIHTWPDYEYMACDVFSCGGEIERTIKHLIESISPRRVYKRIFPRGFPSRSNSSTVFVDDTGPGIQTLMDVELLGRFQSQFQDIQVLLHEKFGRMLVINNDVQFTEKDHHLYDRALLAPLERLKKCRDVLIIGGGDGLCCTYLLKNNLASRIKLLELDPLVVEVCGRFFPELSRGIRSQEVNISFGDATKTIQRLPDESFDAAIVDSTAPKTDWGRPTYSKNFFEQVRRVLRKWGTVCVNGTSIWYKYHLTSDQINRNISTVFGKTSLSVCWIPSFGSPWSFFSAHKKGSLNTHIAGCELNDEE